MLGSSTTWPQPQYVLLKPEIVGGLQILHVILAPSVDPGTVMLTLHGQTSLLTTDKALTGFPDVVLGSDNLAHVTYCPSSADGSCNEDVTNALTSNVVHTDTGHTLMLEAQVGADGQCTLTLVLSNGRLHDGHSSDSASIQPDDFHVAWFQNGMLLMDSGLLSNHLTLVMDTIPYGTTYALACPNSIVGSASAASFASSGSHGTVCLPSSLLRSNTVVFVYPSP